MRWIKMIKRNNKQINKQTAETLQIWDKIGGIHGKGSCVHLRILFKDCTEN